MEHTTAFHIPVIRSAWHIALRERRIWIFSLLAGLIIGSGIGSALIQIYSIDITDGWLGYGEGMIGLVGGLWAQARATGAGAMVTLSVLWVLLLATVAAFIWLVVVSVAAIVLGSESPARGMAVPIGIGKRAIAYTWSVFVVLIFVRVGIFIATAIWHSILFWHVVTPTTLTMVASIVAFIALAGVFSVLHIATPFAVMGVVFDRMRPLRAIQEALVLIRDRWLVIIEVSCVLTIANIIGVIAWLAGSFIIALPFAFLVGIGSTKGIPWLTMTSFAVGGVALTVFTIIIAIIITTFLTSAWTIVYLRLTGQGDAPEPWLTRVIGRKA